MTDDRVGALLVGGGVAAARCARALRRSGFAGSILLVGSEASPPYNRPPLTKELLREALSDELALAEPMTWYARRSVDLRLRTSVIELDPEGRTAVLDDGSTVRFERCLLATGAEPRPLPIEGGERALEVRTLDDARRLRAAVESHPGAAVTVIGGGFIGVEVASSLAALGLRPTIVELAESLWGGALGAELAAWAHDRLVSAGIGVRLGGGVDALEDGAARIGGERLAHAFAVAGVGVRPRVNLAIDAGLATDDGIVTDAAQRTSHPAVWAAGDVARTAGRRVEHWHAAREAGERAAGSMMGADPAPIPVPWLFTEVAGTAVDVIGVADGWDEERWLGGGSVLAYLAGDRAVQLAVIGSVLDAGAARELVREGAGIASIEAAIAARER